jgi:ankyrin repeat protein
MNNSDKTHALIRAVKSGRAEEAAGLISEGAQLNGADIYGWTPLIHAANEGMAKILVLLIEAGADVNQIQESGINPLSSAVIAGRLDCVKLLLKAGAKPHTSRGIPLISRVPLHFKNREKIIELLSQVPP